MLILLDIDGTLLNTKHTIEEETINAISHYKNTNRFILCSARKPSSTKMILNHLHLNEKIIICYNGAIIKEECKSIYENTLSQESVVAILNILSRYNNISVNVFSNDIWIANSMSSRVLNEAKVIGEKPTEIVKNMQSINLEIHKILLMGATEDLKTIQSQLLIINDITSCNSKDGYLEITSSRANKKNALDYLLKYLAFDGNTLAIGDGYNDLELLKKVNIGIAMGNAPIELKNVAKYTTCSNDCNGVAFALKMFLS